MIVTTPLIPKPYSGFTAWPFIFVTPDADKTILPHEMVHYRRQAWWSPLWLLLYVLLPSFRLKEEVLAYRASIKNGMSIEDAAYWLTTYRVGIDKEEAIKLLDSKTFLVHSPC